MKLNYFEGLKNTPEYKKDNQIYLKERVFNTLNNLLKTFFSKSFKKDQFLLDLGSSDGTLIEIAKNFGLQAVGFDIDKINLEKDKINLPDNSCDIVTALSLLEHLSNPSNFIDEVKRVLKKDGFFIIVTPDWQSNVKNFYDDPTHVRPYTTSSLKFLLEISGFKQIKILPWVVNKPVWMWKIPFKFFLAKIIPFRGDTYKWIPNFLKGKSKSILSIAVK